MTLKVANYTREGTVLHSIGRDAKDSNPWLTTTDHVPHVVQQCTSKLFHSAAGLRQRKWAWRMNVGGQQQERQHPVGMPFTKQWRFIFINPGNLRQLKGHVRFQSFLFDQLF
eukprot:EG_transcript_40361